MAFNFPDSPTENQTFTPSGGPAYIYKSPRWLTVPPASAQLVVSDTAPVSPAVGMLWWESDTGNMFMWYSDADSSQWVQVSGAVSARPTAETRNRIVNGAMQISQENGDAFSGASSWYPADQWPTIRSTTGVVSVGRTIMPTLNGSKYRIALGCNTADTSIAAGEFWILYQNIEGARIADFGWGTASARQVILRFGLKAPAGTYGITIMNSGETRSYIAMVTISAGQANTDTVQTIVIPGDTTGTWATDTGLGLAIQFVWACGSTYSGGVTGWQAGPNKYTTSAQTNGLATVGNTFYVSDVGLYLDPLNSGVAPAWTMPDEAQELAACKRYWQQYAFVMGIGAYNAGVNAHTLTPLPQMLRTTPATAFTGITNANCTGPLNYGTGTSVFGAYITSVAVGNMSSTFTVTLNARY